MSVLVGATAPDFVLPGWYDGTVRNHVLAQQLGRPVVLVFYRGDQHYQCARQLRTYSDRLGELEQHDATIWGIASQDVHSHRAFAGRLGLRFPLLADTGSVVAHMYGVVGTRGPRPAVFVIGPEGRIEWRWTPTVHLGYPRMRVLSAVLTDLSPAG